MSFADIACTKDTESLAEMLQASLEGAAAHVMGLSFTHANSGRLLASCTVVPIVIHGRTTGSYLILKDITEQRATEKLLLQAEKLNIAGQLAAAVAHEIRNPLTALKGFIKLLEASNEIRSAVIFSLFFRRRWSGLNRLRTSC
jgi:two-component system, sporulation sensor kinase A